ncbi:hypothetical protein PN459_21540 [Microcystis aeruginosa CS-567/02-A1]|uniref:hypothetical protein n=1 Tax=Microcystis aeruginosa TaxID=1126 RepID=UPI00232ECD27|nr:hypothetical protein [Microcystis aeruginosa]MDB9402539.1 hypothetical protein [Microcystis aeruginosa CS-567/02-A1]
MTTHTITAKEREVLSIAIATLQTLKNRHNSLTVVRAQDFLHLVLEAQENA